MTRIVAQLMVAMLVPVGAAAQAPKIVLTPTSARFQAVARSGLTATQTIRITNGGSGVVAGLSQSIVYTPGQPTGWLTATLSGPSAPANLTLRANASATLPAGTYTATVVIKALNPKSGSPNLVVTFVVGAATTTTQLTSAPNPSVPGQSVVFTVTVSSASGTPAGTLQLVGPNGSALATGTLDAQGVVRFTISTLINEGGVSIGACYAGNGFFGQSCAPLLTQNVQKLATTVALTSSPNPSAPGQEVTFAATVAGPVGTGTPTGTVEYVMGSAVLGTAELDAQGVARLAVSTLPEGNAIVGACYRGDPQFARRCSPLATQRVVAPEGTISGFVRDLDGVGMAGVTLTLGVGSEFCYLAYFEPLCAHSTRTGNDGAYEFSGVQPATYTLRATPATYGCDLFDGASITVAPGDHLTHPVDFNCPGHATGLVTVIGPPPADITVRLTPVRGGATFSGGLFTSFVNGVGGVEYYIAAPPDEYSIAVSGLPARCSSSSEVAFVGGQRSLVAKHLTVTCGSAFAIVPAPYDFGPLFPGETRTVVLTATNQSDAPAPTGDFSWSSDYVTRYRLDFSSYTVADFDIDENGCYNPQTLQPGQRCSVTIHFTPQATGVRHASFSIGGVTAQITGTGDGGIPVSVSPNPHDFGTLNLGATRTVLLTLTNNGPVATAPNVTAITLGGTNASEFTYIPEAGDCVQIGVAPGASCTLRVAFTPTSTGPRSATVTASFQSAVPGWLPGATTATLTGTGSLEAMIFLSSSKDPSVAEEDVTFTALVRHPDGSSLSPMPVGLPITFVVSGETSSHVVALKSDGTASLKTSFKTAGAYPVSATFADDILGTGSNSLTQLVTPLPGDPTVGRVAGTIHDRDGHPVPGVTVFLIGATVPTPVTAADGSYEMNGISPGNYTILATKNQFCIDLNSEEFTVTAKQTTTVSLTMNCPPLLYGAVTVTGPAPAALTVGATPVRGGPAFSAPVLSDGTYSMFIGVAEYNVAAVGPLRCRSSVEGIEGVHQQDLVTADLTVTCTSEERRLTPLAFDFGGVLWGHSSGPATFTLTNVTDHPLSFEGIGVATPYIVDCNGLSCDVNSRHYEFVIESSNCGSSSFALNAGASCSFAVHFTPYLSGPQSGTVGVCSLCNVEYETTFPLGATVSGHGRDAEATLALSPNSFDFGAVQINTSSNTKQFVVVNTGPDSSGPVAVSLTGADAADFELLGKCQGETLAANGKCELNVTFTPHGFGPRTATVTITGTPGGTASVTLTGTGDGLLTINPTTRDFGSVAVGQSGTPVAFTVTNAGSTDVLLNHFVTSGPNFLDFLIDPGSCGPALAPKGSCTFTVKFTPKALGASTATLTVAGTGGAPTVSASLTGTGGGVAVLAFTPASYDFGSVRLGVRGTQTTLTVTNNGSAAAGPLSSTLPGDQFEFETRGSTCTGATLAPASSCTITIEFTPLVPGPRQVTLAVSWAGGSTSAAITGTGTVVESPTLHISSAQHDFGSVVVGQTSATHTFIVTNTGPSRPGFGLLQTTDNDEFHVQVFNSDPCFLVTFPVGGTCFLTVTFTPLAAGTHSATLVFATTDGFTVTASLSGTGVAAVATLTLAPAAKDFGSVPIGSTSTSTAFTVTNSGNTRSGSLQTFSLTGAGAAHYVVDAGTCLGVALDPGATCTVSAKFTPTALGSFPATLTVATNAGESVAANLTGTSTVLSFAPASFDFGSRQVNFTLGGVFFFTITNAGTAATAPLDQFVFTGAAAADFSIADQRCLGVSLAPGASCTLSVQFIPHATGLRSATLTASASTGGASGSAQVSGTGVPPTIFAVTPPTINFGSVDLGQTSPVFTYTLTNTGPSPGGFFITDSLSGVGKADYNQLTSECWGNPVNVGASCRFTVSFSPKAGGPRPATLTLVFQGGTATVNFTGFGTSPNALLAVAPDSQDFGLVLLGQSSVMKTLTVTNVGHSLSGPLVNFLFSGPGSYEFGVVNASNQCSGLALAPGASCTIGLIFTPQVYGVRKATLMISDGGLGGTVTLTGGMTPGGVLSMTPTAKNFGTIPVGSSSSPTQFTVTNTGTTIALVSGIFIYDAAGDDYALDPGSSCASTPFIDIGASCSILVRFKPKRTGPLPATLYFYHDGGTVSADLTGTGGPGAPTPTVGDGGTMELTSFTATDAARDLLGVPTLTAAHRAYLDGTGNHNGTYDLGDLLAFFDRHHIKLSPALLASPDSKEHP